MIALASHMYYDQYMPPGSRDKIISFRPDPDVHDAMADLRDADGVPFAEQIRRALRLWLETKGVLAPRAEKKHRRRRVAGVRTRSTATT